MKLAIALANTKPGTSKTTSSVMLAYALHGMGQDVVLFDADPAGSAVEWSDTIGNGGFPFDVVGLPQNAPGSKMAAYTRPDTIAIVDTPQAEDHAKIVRSILRVADEIVIPVAPALIEIERMSKMADVLEDAEETRSAPARVSVLLTRVVANANSGPEVRDALTGAGYDVLTTEIPRRETYAMAYGAPPERAALPPFADLAKELLTRGGAG
ncbi:hypothetical protein SUDANB121_05974 (plasmid) [Nocardiopsis dassonvillei]|uniref:nucleotide-binding protein n=1 Tax=Nocardiopsis dassonvillei TaxID=2014 RepID=UPI003F562035